MAVLLGTQVYCSSRTHVLAAPVLGFVGILHCYFRHLLAECADGANEGVGVQYLDVVKMESKIPIGNHPAFNHKHSVFFLHGHGVFGISAVGSTQTKGDLEEVAVISAPYLLVGRGCDVGLNVPFECCVCHADHGFLVLLWVYIYIYIV